ncbi:sodium/proline symporter PutP [Rhodoferax sp. PAMC 29310]|uniref:sodium/proline symporter PutP n=1 Tax=Rhodoferax sp. PAMC 29310 TaxID=2822760 RepID=UPI001B33B0DF|nr:sodium/proline symporter PutP [Rhodoferax sp. PAMC 29310]
MILAYTQFGIYLAMMLGIGWYSMSKTSDNAGYIAGGRSLGPATTAISAGASDMSGWLLLGLPGAVFVGGLSEGLWISAGLIIGAYLNWTLVAARLRQFTEDLDAITLPTYIGERFEDKSGILKIVAAVVIMLFFTLYVASGLKGGTLLFAYTFDASEKTAMIITTIVVVSYTFLGGYLAVCWTDLIQGILMFLALLFTAMLGYFAIAGNPVDISTVNPKAFDWKAGSILSGASLMAWGLGYFGQPHILARFVGIKNVESVPAARRIGMSWMIISLFFSTCIGLIGIGYSEAFGLAGVSGEGGNSERVFLALSTVLFHPIFSGFVLAAVLAAVMSTADSQLLVLSSALTEDTPIGKNMSNEKKAWVSRFGVVGFAILAYVIAVTDEGNILSMVAYAWGGFGAAFGPLVILSLMWRDTTKAGAIAGILVGSVSIVVFKNFVAVEGHYLYELLPSFILSFISIVVVSKFSARPSDELLARLKF